jgi:hypothetical protein
LKRVKTLRSGVFGSWTIKEERKSNRALQHLWVLKNADLKREKDICVG